SDENDIVVQSDAVSRVHAYIMQSEGAWYIRDNGSKNGIQVNGSPGKEAWLQNGDVVQVGTFVFRFRDPAAEVPLENAVVESPAAGMPIDAAGYVDPTAGGGAKKKPNRRILIYTVLIAVVGYVLYSNQNSSSDA